jgi:hypothetical protein
MAEQPIANGQSGRAGPTEATATPSEGSGKRSDEMEPSADQLLNLDDREPSDADAANGSGTSAGDTPHGRVRMPLWVRESLSCLVSLVAHMVVLIALGLWVVRSELPDVFAQLQVTPTTQDEERIDESFKENVTELPQEEAEEIQDTPSVEEAWEEVPEFPQPFNDMAAVATPFELDDQGDLTAPRNDLLKQLTLGAIQGNDLSGRGEGSRASLIQRGGGTPGSEKAVARALGWLSRHQNEDGGWNLDHRLGPCQGRCANPGLRAPSRNAATALALLPFLGAGQTHKKGKHQETVGAGIYFLVRSMQVANNRGSFYESGGTMYSHGLGAIALCEAYAMTRDRNLAGPAQMAINFIVAAQDPVGGGWRYEPHQPGDTSVLGWQLMALKSAHMAYLEVPTGTVQRASRFLDSVQREGGAFYGYVAPSKQRRFATTAIGLLCRMYLGWKRDNQALDRGVQWLSKHGPATSDFYGNYYAAQVMFQCTGGQGSVWRRWNTAMRDGLVGMQSRDGHADGSWFLPGGHNDGGGRLYCTAMGAMILEIYYRHMPIYRTEAVEDDFPL